MGNDANENGWQRLYKFAVLRFDDQLRTFLKENRGDKIEKTVSTVLTAGVITPHEALLFSQALVM